MTAAADAITAPDRGTPSERWADAVGLLEKGIEREERALRSVSALTRGTTKGNPALIDEYVARLATHRADLLAGAGTVYRSTFGSEPALPSPDSLASASMAKVPANISPLGTYFEKRRNASYRGGMHSIMREEVYNFVNGKRSYFEIYRAVRAEQLAAGSWYYGTVTLQDVAGQLDAAVAAGALTLGTGGK
jgi:hypothetical protein